MTSFRTFIKRHAVVSFYTLAFAISWGGVLLIIGGFASIPGAAKQTEALLGSVMLAWFAGPSVSSILLTGIVHGRMGYRDLLSRLLRWRVSIRWYAVALLAGPLVFMAGLLPLSLLSPEFLPSILTSGDKASLLLFGIASGLIGGGFLEELGWTGFAVHTLRPRHSALATALIVGVLWGAVHFSFIFWMSGANIGSLPLGLFLVVRAIDLLVGQLLAFRVLIVWVYERTGSLLVAMLMHANLSASMLILGPEAISGVPFMVFCLVSSLSAWIVVAVVALANRGQLETKTPTVGAQSRPIASTVSAGAPQAKA